MSLVECFDWGTIIFLEIINRFNYLGSLLLLNIFFGSDYIFWLMRI